MIPATGRNGLRGTNRRPQEVIDTLGRLEVAVNRRDRETYALADLAIRHHAAIAQVVLPQTLIDHRRLGDAVAELVAQIERVETARRAVDTITDAVNDLNQETLL